MFEGPTSASAETLNGCISNVASFLMKLRQILLRPVHNWVWVDMARRASNLLRFAETEADGGRDLVRAAEVTPDPLLRTLFLFHARDEQRHAELFRRRGSLLHQALSEPSGSPYRADWLAPGERGLDDLRIEESEAGALLAFLHLSEKSAATSFASYRDVLARDPSTRAVFDEVLRDEVYHMNYTLAQLVRVSPHRHRVLLWRARLSRLWKSYLRLALAISTVISGLLLTILYFSVLPPFAYLAKRAARKEPAGWLPVSPKRNASLDREY
jgi:rubrerythrin